jgi:probable HAF family extracellular repeat protein
MNLKTIAKIAVTCFVVMQAMHGRMAAQSVEEGHQRFRLVELGTLGGPNSYFTFITGRSLNKQGMAIGSADNPMAVEPPFCLIDCYLSHAFQWNEGVLTDLGGLLGVTVSGSAPNDINARGVVAGLAFNGGIDNVFGLPFFDGVIWKDGHIVDLGTFGGPLSYAAEINNRDQVVGFALNATPDSFDLGDFCQNFPMPTQMRAFIWRDGVKKDLGTLGGTDSCALFVNEHGLTVGTSFTNSTVNFTTGLPTIHPFLWTGEKMVDLQSLGGTIATANGINDRGQVAGESTLAGDQIVHAFLWNKGKLTDLGNLGGNSLEVIGFSSTGAIVGKADLPGSQTHGAFLAQDGIMMDLGTQDGDPCSVAIGVNSRGQVVGGSTDCSNFLHAFLWENGRMIDLNSFVPTGSSLTLTQADFISETGEITAEAVLPNGDQRAVLLIPCEENQSDDDDCVDASAQSVVSHQTPVFRSLRGAPEPSSPLLRLDPNQHVKLSNRATN